MHLHMCTPQLGWAWAAGRASGSRDRVEGTAPVSTTTDHGIASAPRSALPQSIAPGGSSGPEANTSAHQAASSEARPATDLSGGCSGV